MKITVQYIAPAYTQYVWVRPVPKPPTGGHKALKNEDFIDHDDLMLRNSYYQQIVSRQITERYLYRPTGRNKLTPQQEAFNKEMGVGKPHSVEQLPSGPLFRLPIVDDSDE